MSDTVTVRIPRNLRQELQAVAKTEHVPVSDLVREAIRRTILIHRFRGLRKKALPYAQAQGFLTDEDVFNAIS